MVVPGYVYPDDDRLNDGGWLDDSVRVAAAVVLGAAVVGVFTVGAVVCWAVDRFERRRR